MALLTGSFYGEGEYSIDEYAQIRLVERQLLLSWTASVCPDADFYTVRFAPDTTDPIEDAAVIHRTTSFLQFQQEETFCEIDDRRGKYFISCTDTSGNEGDPVEFIYEEQLAESEWSLRREIVGHPNWRGSFEDLRQVGSTLRISLPASSQPESGLYYPSFSVIDFGDPQEIRLISDPMVANNEDTELKWQWGDALDPNTAWRNLNNPDEIVTLGGRIGFRLDVHTRNNSKECGADFAALKIYQKGDSL